MTEDLNELRPRMMSVAYRMLGSVADAEDAVQDAFLRLQAAEEVTSPEGFLVKTTTRRCIDQLRADRRRKEYIGPWVPEPVDTRTGAQNSALADSLGQAFLLMLECLSPDERAAFLLRTVFDYEYAEIAEVVGKSEVYVRQIVSRPNHVCGGTSRGFRPASHDADGMAGGFVAACRAGDVNLVEQMFTEDVESAPTAGARCRSAS